MNRKRLMKKTKAELIELLEKADQRIEELGVIEGEDLVARLATLREALEPFSRHSGKVELGRRQRIRPNEGVDIGVRFEDLERACVVIGTVEEGS